MSEIHIHTHHYCGNPETEHLLRGILKQGKIIMATQEELTAAVNAANTKLTKIGTETTTLLTKVDELKSQVAANPVSPGLQAAVDAIVAQAQVVDDLVPDVSPSPPAPPTP